MSTFNPQNYWENRLKDSFDLHGVGYIGLGIQYNKFLYKVRKFAFRKLMKKLNIKLNDKKVLDIGSGTGFYIERWKEMNVASVQGSDITEVVIKKLQAKFPNETFVKLDIGEKNNLPLQKFDIISAFDVLFHIVDDTRLEQAIQNIHQLLRSDGYFIISDNFIHGKTIRLEHQVSRSCEYMNSVVENSGFKHILTVPMFIFMNNPVDTNNRIIKKIFWLISVNVRKKKWIANLIGNIIMPIEKILISLKSEGPSTEIKVYQKVNKNES